MRTRTLLLLLCCFAAADTAAQSSLLEELAQARSKWESQRIEDYSFVISNSCACPDPLHKGPLQVVVEEGRLRRVVYLGESRQGYVSGQAARKRSPLRAAMPGLFEFIEKQLRRGSGAGFKIKYDAKTGHLLRFEYPDAGDGTARIEIKDFKRLES